MIIILLLLLLLLIFFVDLKLTACVDSKINQSFYSVFFSGCSSPLFTHVQSWIISMVFFLFGCRNLYLSWM